MSWRTAPERRRIARLGGKARVGKLSKEEHTALSLKMNAARWKKVERAEEMLMKRVKGPKEVELGEMSAKAFERIRGEECS